MKRFLSVLGVAMMLSTSLVAHALSTKVYYDDLHGSYAQSAIISLVEQGMLSGEGSFNGTNKATRAFAVEVIAKGMGLEPVEASEPTFSDVAASHESYGYIESAYSAGLIAGDKGSENAEGKRTFRPDAAIIRAEVAKIVAIGNDLESEMPAKDTFTDVPGSQWYAPFVEKMYWNSVANGYKDSNGNPTGQFGPGDEVIRQDVVVMVSQAQSPVKREGLMTEEEMPEEDSEEEVEVEADADDSSDSSADNSSSSDVAFNSSANYTGPFPAPEGMVLEGTYGSDEYSMPEGDGVYQFKIQTEWERPIACLDDTRIRVGSKGASWDTGWATGYDTALRDLDVALPVYDPEPIGNGAGGELYDEGYKLGYDRAWDGLSNLTADYVCPGYDVDLDVYDEDGWYKLMGEDVHEDFESLDYIYAPPTPFAGVTYSDESILGPGSQSLVFKPINEPIHEADTNSGTESLKIDQIDILDGEMDTAEQALSTEEFAQAIYDGNKYQLETVAHACTVYDPVIADVEVGDNTFVGLVYFQLCGNNLNQIAYFLMPNRDGDRMLLTYFQNVDMDVADADGNVDEDKLMNSDFIDQFLEKVSYR